MTMNFKRISFLFGQRPQRGRWPMLSPPLETQNPASRLKIQPGGSKSSLKAQNPASNCSLKAQIQSWSLKFQHWGSNLSLEPSKLLSIGHRPLRGRCPSHHHTSTYTHIGATGTADHLTLLRLFTVDLV